MGIGETFLIWSNDICTIDNFLIEKTLQNPQEYRFFIIITNHEYSGFIGGMKMQIGNWWCYAGLFLIKNAHSPLTE